MRQQERMGYASAGGWRMVTLPTVSDVVVDVLLSDTGTHLTTETLTALYRSSTSTKVDLALPTFRVETEAVLNNALRRLGIVKAFTRDADFSGITSAEQIWIDTVVHKAVLNLDESGFEGAAATAVVLRTLSMDVSAPQTAVIPNRYSQNAKSSRVRWSIRYATSSIPRPKETETRWPSASCQ